MSKSKKFHDCICGKSQCHGLTSAFYLLRDLRHGFTKLPPAFHDENGNFETDKLRDVYLRHLGVPDDFQFDTSLQTTTTTTAKNSNTNNNNKKKKLYIANHHFHPDIICKKSTPSTKSKSCPVKVPIFIKREEMIEMKLNLTDEDKFTDGGFFGTTEASYYYVVPNYSLELAQQDLKKKLRVDAMLKEASISQSLAKKDAKKKKTKQKEAPLGSNSERPKSMVATSNLTSDVLGSNSERPSAGSAYFKQYKKSDASVSSCSIENSSVAATEDEFLSQHSRTSINKSLREFMDEQDGGNTTNDDYSVDSAMLQDNKWYNDAIVLNGAKSEQQQTATTDASSQPLPAEETSSIPAAGEATNEKGLINEESNNHKEQALAAEEKDRRITIHEYLFPPAFVEIGIMKAKTQDELSAFETKRLNSYKCQHDLAYEEYVRSLSILRDGLSELLLGERVIIASAHANEAYASAMKSIFEDTYLDDNNNPIQNSKRSAITRTMSSTSRSIRGGLSTLKEKALSSNSVHGKIKNNSFHGDDDKTALNNTTGSCRRVSSGDIGQSVNSFHGRLSGDDDLMPLYETTDTGTEYETQSVRSDASTMRRATDQLLKNKSGIIYSVLDSKDKLSKGFGSNASNSKKLAAGMKAFRSHTKKEIRSIESMGRTIFKDIESAELRVQDAWDMYKNVIIMNSDSDMATPETTNSESFPEYEVDDDDMDGKNNSHTDRWVVEMHYRVAVSYQVMAWKNAFTDLWKLMQKTERDRFNFLKEKLLDYVPRQRRLFSSFSSMQQPVLENLLSKSINAEDDNGEAIDPANNILCKHFHVKDDGTTMTAWETPLITSQLHSSSKILQRKAKVGFKEYWRNTLAVMTADSYLHLFDIPTSSSSSEDDEITSMTESQAFLELAPTTFHLPGKLGKSKNYIGEENIVLNDNADTKNKLSTNYKLLKSLIPSESYYLPNCSVSASGEHWEEFEVIEQIENNNTVFSRSKQKTRRLRTNSAEETALWIGLLNRGPVIFGMQ